MKKIADFHKKDNKILRNFFCIALSLLMLCLAACDGGKKTGGSDLPSNTETVSNSSDIVSSGEMSSNGESTPESSLDSSTSDKASSSDESSVKNETSAGKETLTADPLTGGYSVEVSTSIPSKKNNEYKYAYSDELVVNPLTGTYIKGGAETQALKRRKEILNTPNTDYKVSGTTYYVSPDGNSSNDGLSPEKPVSNISTLPLSSGDAVLFERGSVFRISEPISCVSGVTYGAYGKGSKPAIYGSPKNYAQKSLWVPSRMKNVWRLDFPYKEAGGIIFDHGKDAGIKKKSGINQLVSNGYFYHNEGDGYFYMYCDKGNPGELYKDIEILPSSSIFVIPSYASNVTIDNLSIKYVGVIGINCMYGNSGITVTNCEVAWIGGSRFNSDTRYGNGIQWWGGGKNNTVENCWVYQIFDTAISPQGESGIDYENFTFKNNLIEYCCCSIEFWDKGSNGKKSVFKNFRIKDNIMRTSGYGWGNRSFDDGIRGIEGHIFAETDNNLLAGFDIHILDNIFDTSFWININWAKANNSNGSFEIKGNSVYQTSDQSGNIDDFRFGSNTYKTTDQGSLEVAWKTFDSQPGEIKWLG